MRVRDRVALNSSPLFLRVMLGGILLWMGLGKILDTFETDGAPAATLARMGVITPASAKPAAPPSPASSPATPTTPGAPKEAPKETPKGGAAGAAHDFGVRLVAQTAGTTPYRAEDFPTPVKVRKLYMIALAIEAAANPKPGPGANPPPKTSFVPAALGSGSWPVKLAWACAVGEAISGVGLLLGLLTRTWALLMAGRMLAAIWVTQVGPSLDLPNATLGFLPPHATFDSEAWRPFAFQFALFMSSLALLFLGPGRASLDHAVLAKPRPEDDDED